MRKGGASASEDIKGSKGGRLGRDGARGGAEEGLY